jgi:hypothetical protein
MNGLAACRRAATCNMQYAMPCTPQKESYRTLYVHVPRGYTARLPPASLIFPKFQVPASSVDNNHSISRAPSLPTLLYFSRQRVERVDSRGYLSACPEGFRNPFVNAVCSPRAVVCGLVSPELPKSPVI